MEIIRLGLALLSVLFDSFTNAPVSFIFYTLSFLCLLNNVGCAVGFVMAAPYTRFCLLRLPLRGESDNGVMGDTDCESESSFERPEEVMLSALGFGPLV